ncbi:MAG TPA: Na+/H+ antiporter [Solirubrobacteraceae bacterium]|nr:Na+/H+ antiporter [Solirubrobacteraceae bacterium]
MAGAEVLVFLLVAVALLAGFALRHDVPYPIVLVLGGLALGFVPWLPAPELEPDIIFFVFLPPLLYAAAFQASAYELRANAGPIALLAIGLVIATVVAVAVVAHHVIGLPWPLAFVLGAVVGPTDPVAAAAVLGRLGAPARIRSILEGESLVNDGTGLTAYALAVAAIGTTVTASDVVTDFVVKAAGGIAIGLAAGWLFSRLRGMTREPSIDLVLSILTPFVAYVPAEHIHVSGVLAVVTAGVVIGSRSQEHADAGTRLRTLAFWQSADFLLNSLLFLLIGLQLVDLVEGVDDKELAEVAAEALLIAAIVFGVRLAWMLIVPAVAHLRIVPREPTGLPERILLSWCGMRGSVSLAAALAVPASVGERELVILVTYGVVLVTLVLPGLTLAPLIRRLGLGQSEELRRQEVEARMRLTHAALERFDEIGEHGDLPEPDLERLRDRYQARLDRLRDRLEEAGGHPDHRTEAAEAQIDALEAERDALDEMRRERAFPAELLRDLEAEIDVDEARVRSRGR